MIAVNRPSPSDGRRLAVAREGGFMMIDMLVTIIFIGLIFAAFSILVSALVTHSAEITNESVLQTQVRAAVEELTADVRQAYPPDTTATSPFVTAGTMSPTSITFYSPDRLYSQASPTAFHLREISYQLSGGKLQRSFVTSTNTDGPPWTIGSMSGWVTRVGAIVNADIFTYYDGANPPAVTTNPASVATVVVKLTVTTPTGHGRQYTYTDSATLRVSK